MGWCHEFGTEIEAGCGHPMVAGASACSCAECGTLCQGRFEGGCEAVWSRAPRANPPGRPANYAAKAIFEPSLSVAPANGDSSKRDSVNGDSAIGGSPTSARPDGANVDRTPARRPGPGADPDLIRRLTRLELTVSSLTDQMARQSERQATMERHLADLGRVLGELGVEAEDRLCLIEKVLDDLTAPVGPQAPPVPEPSVPPEALDILPEHAGTPVSLIVPLRRVSDDTGPGQEVADLTDDVYQPYRSP